MARVFIRECPQYDPDRIQQIIGECMDELSLKPRGLTMVKPNTVIAHDVFFPHAYTRPEFLDGLFGALRERDDDVEELWCGERCGITVPTRYAFAEAGYGSVLQRHGVRPKYFDEMPQVQRNLFADGRLRDYIYIPEAVAATEWLVTAPKFKAHPWTKVTFNLKLYIGMQDDEQRLIDHDHRLHTKIADLFEVVQPRLCAMDAIVAGAKTMLTPKPFPLGLIIVGDDAVATDAVCSHIAGLDPHDVDHIRITAERGWGPIDLNEIELDGDISLERAKARAEGFELTLDKIDTHYNGRSNIQVYLGPPPDTYDYCWGGCPGSLTEAMGIIGQLQPNVVQEVKPIHLVYGAYEGEIHAQPGEPILFVGDCATWCGKLDGETTEVPFLYTQRHLIKPEAVRPFDILSKALKVLREVWQSRTKRSLRVRGCTVSVAEMLFYLSHYAKTKNPLLDPRVTFKFAWYFVVAKIARFFGKRRAPCTAALDPRSTDKTQP